MMERFISKLRKTYYRVFSDRVEYIPMRLPVEKITEEFEKLLRAKIKRKVRNYHIREADEDDLNSIVYLFDQAWHSTTMPFIPLSKNKIAANVLHNPDKMFLIAEIDSKDCGFVLIVISEHDKTVGEISALGIVPEYQHKGIGTLLGIASWDVFKERGVKELRCKVYKDNQISKSFLMGLGFEEISVRDKALMHNKIPI